MLRLIYGAKGSGKTANIIAEANEIAEKSTGSIVFLTDTDRYKFELKYHIRLINVTEYAIKTELGLTGFIRGVLASNADIDILYIDGAHRIIGKDVTEMESFYSALREIAGRCNVEIVATVSTDELPSFLDSYDKTRV